MVEDTVIDPLYDLANGLSVLLLLVFVFFVAAARKDWSTAQIRLGSAWMMTSAGVRACGACMPVKSRFFFFFWKRVRRVVNEKCPLSVPAKPSKSRISRLAVISSFSQEMVDGRGKVKPLSKLSSTPNPKVKQVAAMYLTTPGNKNCLPSPNSFRSVQNPKPTSIAEPNNRTVAKALVFQSPKKVISIKTSSELRTPLTKICEGMKRLGISCQRKRILGYSNKSSKDIRRDPDKSSPLNPSRRKLSAYKDKSKAKELFGPPNCKEKGNKLFNSMPREIVENDLIGMKIDMKSRDSSVNQTQDKNLKEGLTVDATGAQGVKNKKPKPTNPKPFRLRTDRNDKCLEQRKCNHDTNESSGNELQKNYKKDEPKQSRTASEGQAYPNITPQRCSKSTQQNPKPITFRLEYGRDVNSQKSENSLRKTKSSSQHEQFISPKGRKAMAYGKQHTVIKETSSTASRSEEAGEPSHSDISHANKAATSSASRSLSQGKRPLTIPKEPNFHNVHIPKCCARKVA
ncbi:hypothetical protein HYC85_009100 [Camellia sinensis]|uniref:Uncharacterized protein n=1 Tax=Camellia sinensis TaxID=4442 RepID=A0A7J7HGY5_CAMSI|nr:hypothetical protein HYC85_009100 [Camellia sinensis]